jgi:DNA-binding IscR family transcriptional regulator
LVNPKKVSLRKVVEAIEGRVATAGCLIHGAKPCPWAKKCPHRRVMGEIKAKIEKILDEYSLEEMGRM